MISKTKDTVIFHATTDDYETLAASPERDVALPHMDVIFKSHCAVSSKSSVLAKNRSSLPTI